MWQICRLETSCEHVFSWTAHLILCNRGAVDREVALGCAVQTTCAKLCALWRTTSSMSKKFGSCHILNSMETTCEEVLFWCLTAGAMLCPCVTEHEACHTLTHPNAVAVGVLLLRRLLLPLPLSPSHCSCRRALDAVGDHCAACAMSPLLANLYPNPGPPLTLRQHRKLLPRNCFPTRRPPSPVHLLPTQESTWENDCTSHTSHPSPLTPQTPISVR